MSRHHIIPTCDLPVRAAQHPARHRDKPKDPREHRVCLEREDEEREQREAPDDQVDGECGIVLFGSCAEGSVGAGGTVGGGEAEGGELQETEGEPEDGEEGHYHHGEEVAHYPGEIGGLVVGGSGQREHQWSELGGHGGGCGIVDIPFEDRSKDEKEWADKKEHASAELTSEYLDCTETRRTP